MWWQGYSRNWNFSDFFKPFKTLYNWNFNFLNMLSQESFLSNTLCTNSALFIDWIEFKAKVGPYVWRTVNYGLQLIFVFRIIKTFIKFTANSKKEVNFSGTRKIFGSWKIFFQNFIPCWKRFRLILDAWQFVAPNRLLILLKFLFTCIYRENLTCSQFSFNIAYQSRNDIFQRFWIFPDKWISFQASK